MFKLFEHEIDINIDNLQFEPFKGNTDDVSSFDCGNTDLNDFLCTEEVKDYEEELIGKTTLVFYEGSLVAYYTITYGSLRSQYVKSFRSFSKASEMNIRDYPALIIGRLATHIDWQSKGVGRTVVQKIIAQASTETDVALRLVVVQAKNDAIPFYEKLGFSPTYKTSNERKRIRTRGTRTMVFDLHASSSL